MSDVLAGIDLQASAYVQTDTVSKNSDNNKVYFKVFLINSLLNKRKFQVSNLLNLHKDIDGYENMPVTLVEKGLRKGNHPNPKDANIFEANYQNKYSYVTDAIKYYRQFEVAKIVKIYKPILNLNASNSIKDLNDAIRSIDPNEYYALCETQNQKMIKMLDDAQKFNKKIFVSPAMFSWDWTKDSNTGNVSVNSIVPTHLAIVDSPAYDPEIAYIKKNICKKDGISCYYELLEASDIEKLNNDNPKSNNMSSTNSTNPATAIPPTVEQYLKSYYSTEVVDQKNIPAEDIVKNMDNYIILDKTKMKQPPTPTPPQQPTITSFTDPPNVTTTTTEQPTKKEQEEVPNKKETKEKEQKQSFTLDDVKALLKEQKDSILSEIKAEQTKGERSQIIESYFGNDKIKSVKDKIDTEKLNKAKDFINTLPLDNDHIKAILETSIYNPKFSSQDVLLSVLGTVTEQSSQPSVSEKKSSQQQQQKEGTLPQSTEIKKLVQTPITEIPPKSIPNINSYGTEFKASSSTANRYNDNFTGKGRSFEASSNNKSYKPIPLTGENIPKRFQKYIQ